MKSRRSIGKLIGLTCALLLVLGFFPLGVLAASNNNEMQSPVTTYTVEYYQVDDTDPTNDILLGTSSEYVGDIGDEITLEAGTAEGELDYFRLENYEQGEQVQVPYTLDEDNNVIKVVYRHSPTLTMTRYTATPSTSGEGVVIVPGQTAPLLEGSMPIFSGFNAAGMVQIPFVGISSNGKFEVKSVYYDESEDGLSGALYFVVWKSPDQGGQNRYPETDPVIPGASYIDYTPKPATADDSYFVVSCAANYLTLPGPLQFSWAMGGVGGGDPGGWSIINGQGDPIPFSGLSTYTVLYYRSVDGVRTGDAPLVVTGRQPLGTAIPVDAALAELVGEGYSYVSSVPVGAVVTGDPANNVVVVDYNRDTSVFLV